MKLDELEIGQRFRFVVDDATLCVYAGESPCGRWFAHWEYRVAKPLHELLGPPIGAWSIEETADGEEEVICE